MQLNTLIIAQGRGIHLNSQSIELEHRIDGLLALYVANIGNSGTDRHHYRSLANDFVSRGGQIHYAIDADNRVVGSAYMLVAHSPLQNLLPVERFFVETDIDADNRLAVAKALLASIVGIAEQAAESQSSSVWVELLIPEGSIEHPASQPIYGALDSQGFQGMSIRRALLWTRLIEPGVSDETT